MKCQLFAPIKPLFPFVLLQLSVEELTWSSMTSYFTGVLDIIFAQLLLTQLLAPFGK